MNKSVISSLFHSLLLFACTAMILSNPYAEALASETDTPIILAQQGYDSQYPQPRERRYSSDTRYSQRSFEASAPMEGEYPYANRPQPQQYPQQAQYPQQQQYPQQGRYPQQPPNYQNTNTCRDCATIESVREVKQEGQGSGLGAIGGAVAGGLLGNQIGAGRGKTVGAVVGAVGGAYAGNEVEKSARSSRVYEITLRFDDGNTRVITDTQPPPFQRGDRVRFVNGQIYRM